MELLKYLLPLLALTFSPAGIAEQNVAALMRDVIVPASDGVFVLGKTAPRSDADWVAVQKNAEQLAAAAKPLSELAPPNARPDWARFASAMGNAARTAATAAHAKNLDHAMDAGDELYDTCEGCHKGYLKR